MVQKNPFLKYLIKDKKEDVFHSSGYAKAQNGGNIGAASSESYAVRVNVNQHRQVVRGYRDSELMTSGGNKRPKAETYKPPVKENNSGIVNGMANATARAEAASVRPPISIKKPGISLKK